MKSFRKLAIASLVLVYLVIIAGAVVRMTGSGMGCPDWPKCFGYYIPPTEAADLEWQPGRDYRKGQVIIWNESLLVAATDFTTETTFIPEHWTPYTRHNYAVFNPYHTWTEFINRLLGALAGLATLCMGIASFAYRKTRPLVTWLSWITVLAMGFQGWLGATVVYSVLEPVRITLHMLVALGIVALLCYLIRAGSQNPPVVAYDRLTYSLIVLTLVLTLIQVGFGTQVRQFIDARVHAAEQESPGTWLDGAGLLFYVHRSFSLVVLALTSWLFIRLRKAGHPLRWIRWIILLIGLSVITGMAMNYLDFPFGTQALHLVLAALLFGAQFSLLIEARNTMRVSKTL